MKSDHDRYLFHVLVHSVKSELTKLPCSVQETEEIIDLCGSLQAVHTGCVKWLDHLTMATRREETSSPQSRFYSYSLFALDNLALVYAT
jgi:hypothetical protein